MLPGTWISLAHMCVSKLVSVKFTHCKYTRCTSCFARQLKPPPQCAFVNFFIIGLFSGDHPGRIVTASQTDGELYNYTLSRGEEDILSTPKRSLDRKILWMDGTMTLGRPRHIVVQRQRSISGMYHILFKDHTWWQAYNVFLVGKSANFDEIREFERVFRSESTWDPHNPQEIHHLSLRYQQGNTEC